MTRAEARQLLASDEEVSYDQVEEVFSAFGFSSEFEAPDATIYVHVEFINCGSFRARDRYGWGVVSLGQRRLIQFMVECVAVNERRYGREL